MSRRARLGLGLGLVALLLCPALLLQPTAARRVAPESRASFRELEHYTSEKQLSPLDHAEAQRLRAAPGSRALSAASPSSGEQAEEGEKPLLTALKNSGPGVGYAMFSFLAVGLLANVDVTVLLTHAQWVTFAPFLEGYAANSTILWTSTVPRYYESWGTTLHPLALNVSIVGADALEGTLDDACSGESTVGGTNSSSASSNSTRRRLLEVTEDCTLTNARQLKRAITFANVACCWLIGLMVAISLSVVWHVVTKKKWAQILDGSIVFRTEEDIPKKPWNYWYLGFTAPRPALVFVYLVGMQPMAFASSQAMSTQAPMWIGAGAAGLLLGCVLPLVFAFVHLKKVLPKWEKEKKQKITTNHKCTYRRDFQGWRDIVYLGSSDSNYTVKTWRSSKFVAGWGVLFRHHKPEFRLWYVVWLSLQTFICFCMSMTVPWTAKIQALVILAVYFLYFFITLLFRPWRAILGTAMHLLVCLHNFVCTGFSQFTDDEGLFNSGPTSLEEGATENDGIMIALAFTGCLVSMLYVTLLIVFKVTYWTGEPTTAKIDEDMAEVHTRSKSSRSNNSSDALSAASSNADSLVGKSVYDQSASVHARHKSSMLQDIIGGLSASSKAVGAEDGMEMGPLNENPMLAGKNIKAVAATQPTTTEPAKATAAATAAATTTAAAEASPAVAPVPAPAPAPAPAPLPPEWREHVDPGSGKVYYHNTQTNKTQWHRPS